MTKAKFIDIYKNVLSAYVLDIENIEKGIKKKCLKFNSRKAMKIYDFYENKRRYVRRYFMEKENQLIDRHKIGAIFMYAVLKSKPFSVNKLIPNLPDQLLMANEYLALYMGLSIVESYREYDNTTVKNQVSGKLILPCTYHGGTLQDCGEEYVNNICKALYYIKNPNYFDIFAYADILFLLEKYTDIITKTLN